MKKLYLIFILTISTILNSYSQTWVGTVSNNWNTPSNWSPAVVPGSSSLVTIQASANNPSLPGNITIGALSTQSGSSLNFNGFTLTISGANAYNSCTNTTFLNSNLSTDIVMNITTPNGGYNVQFNGCTFSDHVTFNLNGSDNFHEGLAGANIFNGNLNVNISSALLASFSNWASQYNGNLNINRTVAGTTQMFVNGGSVTGNFSYQNLQGGSTSIGANAVGTLINGNLSINAQYTSPASFYMSRVKNLTNGGTINVQNSIAPFISKDSLRVGAFAIQGYRGGAYAQFFDNRIEGNTTIEDHSSYSSGYSTEFRNNTWIGNLTFTLKGTNNVIESNSANWSSTYNGNSVFNLQGTGDFYLSNADTSVFNGNLTIHRTIGGYNQLFASGAIINGNLVYNNTSSGHNDLGHTSYRTIISGTVNMNVNLTVVNRIQLYRLINQTAGGKINVFNSLGFDVRNDSLIVDSLNIRWYRGGAYANFSNNRINGHVTLADSTNYTSGYETYISNSTINGHTTCSMFGTNHFYESHTAPNIFNGNLQFNISGVGNLHTSHNGKSTINGNFSVNRTGAGHLFLFKNGINLLGNFSCTKTVGGHTEIGDLSHKSSVGGTINLNITQNNADNFYLFRLQNSTNGGSISVNGTKAPSIQQDTLLVNSLQVNSYGGGAYMYLLNNKITGNVTLSDASSYGSGYQTYVRNCLIDGNVQFTINGTNNFYETHGASTANTFNGNVVYTINGNPEVRICDDSKSLYNGNLTIQRNTAGTTRCFASGVEITGNLLYTNTAGGHTYFGTATTNSTINGSLNITSNQTTVQDFHMFRVKSISSGGSVNITSPKAPSIQNDTLFANVSITGYGGGAYMYFLNNRITGNLALSDATTYGSGYESYVRNNYITGNTNITLNGTNQYNEADVASSSNTFLGNVGYKRNGGTLNIATVSANFYHGHLSFEGISSAINANLISLEGSNSTNLGQTGFSTAIIDRLSINKTNGAVVTLLSPIEIDISCTFNTGYLKTTATNNLIFDPNSIQVNASDNSHVIGYVTRKGNALFTFPLGTGVGYNPLGLAASSQPLNQFTAGLIAKNPTDDGYNIASKAGSLFQVAPYHYWSITDLLGSQNIPVTLYWGNPCINKGITNVSNMRVAKWNGTQWDNITSTTSGTTTFGSALTGTIITAGIYALASTTNANQWQIPVTTNTTTSICSGNSAILTASGASAYTWMPGALSGSSVVVTPTTNTTYTVVGTSTNGCPTYGTHAITVNNSCPTDLTVKAFIQGFYSGAGQMQSVLSNQGQTTIVPNQCDYLTIELHEATFPYSLHSSAVKPILKDGTSNQVYFSIIGGNYYIVLTHRNGLETWSATPVTFSASNFYDFTNAATKAYGNNMVEVQSGKWAIYSGDIDQNGYLELDDYNLWDIEYQAGFPHNDYTPDLDGNGYVELDDYNIWDMNYQNGVFSVRP